jgi:poly-gamma-glutamate synthesis protein (capsule biosynthesis protein)
MGPQNGPETRIAGKPSSAGSRSAGPSSGSVHGSRDRTEAEQGGGRFSVIAVGDVMMGKIAQSFIHEQGLDYPFARVRNELSKHDIAFANLEAPISSRGREKVKKMYRLRVNPAAARALVPSGLDVVSLANNHMMDFGETALADTVKHLDSWRIKHAGGGADLEEAREPARFVAAGTEVVFLAYCAWYPAPIHARKDRAGVAPLDRDLILEDIRKHKREDNVVLVSLHWGVQHTDRATRGQVRLAHDIIDTGADAILGHHPHRPQEVEIYNGGPIAYSLGNFLFGYYNKIYRNNIALVLEFEGSSLASARILPIAGKNGRIRFQPHVLTGGEGLAVLKHVARISKRFGTDFTAVDGAAEIDLTPAP